MLSRTITVQTKDDATEAEYAKDTARAIKGLLVGLSDGVKALVFAELLSEIPEQLGLKPAHGTEVLSAFGGMSADTELPFNVCANDLLDAVQLTNIPVLEALSPHLAMLALTQAHVSHLLSIYGDRVNLEQRCKACRGPLATRRRNSVNCDRCTQARLGD